MNTLLNSLNSYKFTENGAIALNTTGNAMLDAFGTIGAMRLRNDEYIANTFMNAWKEDMALAKRFLFYIRDARGGLGERKTFRVIIKELVKTPEGCEFIKKNIKNIPEFGRWDDLYTLIGTPIENEVFQFIEKQLYEDMEASLNNGSVSLLAKWLKSANSKNDETRKLGLYTAKKLKMSERHYRKILSALRHYIDVTEVKMSDNKWGEIDYQSVPSKAHNNYRNAFYRHDMNRYTEYIDAVNNGTAKINSSVLYPYDLIKAYMHRTYSEDKTIEAQWNALPNYAGDKNFLVMVDTSGSMMGRPMETSVGLGIYFAQRNKGAFKNHFMTFSERPEMLSLDENASLYDSTCKVLSTEWGYRTNLEAAFELILNAAIKDNVPAEDMPDALVVITDMEIDSFGNSSVDFTSEMKKRFANAGYAKFPTIVWWNVNARQDTFHATQNEDVRFVSGSSSTIFEGLCNHMGYTPYELMYNVLMSERYNVVL